MAGIPAGMEDEFSDDDGFMVHNYSKDDNEDEGSRKIIRKSAYIPTIPTSRYNDSEIAAPNDTLMYLPEKTPKGRSPPIVKSVIVDDLRLATVRGNLPLVEEFLNKGFDVDTVMKSDWTCLMYACSCGHSSVVKFLLEKKADPNYQKGSALFGDIDVKICHFATLQKKSVKVVTLIRSRPLCIALCFSDRSEITRFTPVLAVCASRQEKEEELLTCLQLLAKYGAKANVWDRHHVTPLMYCARENRLKMLQEILSQNVDVNRHDNRGWTALFWAASNGHGQSIRILLEGGADPTKMATNGQTAADVAYAQKHEEIGDILEKIRNHSEGHLDDNDKESLGKARRGKRNMILEAPNTKSFTMYGELEMFLSGLNLREYISLFHTHKISFYDFLLLTEEDLEKMGIDKVGVRKSIVEGIRTVHLKKWEKSSLPDLKKQQHISCPDAVTMMANISSHLHYIKSSVRYLRNQIQKTPRILELGQEAANVHRLLEESNQCLKNERILFDELRFFSLYLEKMQDKSEFLPADLIVETVQTEKFGVRKLSCMAIFSITFVVSLLVWRKPRFLTKVIVIPQKWNWMLT